MIKFVKQIQQSLCEHVVNYTLEMVRKLYPKFNWVATDENGTTFLFESRPKLGDHVWIEMGGGSCRWDGIDLELSDNWKDSLIKLHEIDTIIISTRWIANLKWMATDEQGDTHVYEHKPKLIDGEWQASSIAGLVMSINYYYYSDGYKKSLRKLKWE